MFNKTKRELYLYLLLTIIVVSAVVVVFELLVDDPKGEENAVKKFYYEALRVIPVTPAVRLKVPYHHQQYSLSCEVASLLMALEYKGVAVTEDELIKQLPVSDPGPRQPGNIWGDPNLGFVGNINGIAPNGGYGVYEQPIYDLAIKYRSAKIITNGILDDLITELTNGNPIVVWGVVGDGRDISWETSEGKTIVARLDEHARTLIGFTGNSANPKRLIFLDPIYGEIRMSVPAFLKNWSMMENRAVVVY